MVLAHGVVVSDAVRNATDGRGVRAGSQGWSGPGLQIPGDVTAPLRVRSAGHSRLDGLDIARPFAFVGVVTVNFDVVMVGATNAETGIAQLLQGRAAAAFVVLAGVCRGLAARQRSR